jgi:VWFA-related protein
MNCRVAVALLVVMAMPLTSQQPATSNGTVTFSTTAQLVVETVVVKDKNGKTVEGLTAKDFTITEDGAPQTIQFCEFQKVEDQAPGFAVRPAETAAPAVTSNQIAPEVSGDIRYKDRRLLVLYFDMTAMPQPDQLRALAAAQKFIKTMSTADLMAILEYTGAAVKVLNDFTGDRDVLQKSIDTMVIGEGSGFDNQNADDSTADTGAAFGQDDSEFNIFNTDRQLAALQTSVKMLASLNEKKSFIYFASGLRLNGINNQAQMQATTNAAIRSNVSFYPVDARGLVASAPLGDATRGSPGGIGMYSGNSALVNTGNFQQSQDTLYTLASDTGGKALLDYNDLTLGIIQAEQAISSYYIIGYYTTKSTPDGKFRRIKIAYNADPSVKLAYRQGYYANKTFSKFTTSDKERQLEEALMLGDPVTELTLAMEVNYFQLNRAEYFVPLAVKIPGSELAIAKRGGAEHTLIDFIGEVKDEFGTTVSNVRDNVNIKLSGETAAELSKHPVTYDTGFTLLPGKYSIKFLARDDETGRIGTYLLKFTVPNLNKEDKRIPISSVVLSGQRLDLKDSLYTAKDKMKSEGVNPLIQDGQKLLPSVTRVFSRSRDMYVYLQAYEPSAAAFQPLVAFVTFYRGQAKAFETPPLPVTEGLDNKLKTVPLKFDLTLTKLPPGKYNCQVTVIDPSGQKAAFWSTPVMLVP